MISDVLSLYRFFIDKTRNMQQEVFPPDVDIFTALNAVKQLTIFRPQKDGEYEWRGMNTFWTISIFDINLISNVPYLF